MDNSAQLKEDTPQYPDFSTTPMFGAPPGNSTASPVVSPILVDQPKIVHIPIQTPVIPELEAPDHLGMAILVTVCCCLPLGVISILKALRCRSARAKGDRAKALRYGGQAKELAMIGLGCGLIILALMFLRLIVEIDQ